jgi:hypothetical protein
MTGDDYAFATFDLVDEFAEIGLRLGEVHGNHGVPYDQKTGHILAGDFDLGYRPDQVAAAGEVNFVVNRDHPNVARDRGRPARHDDSNVRRQTAEGVDYMLLVDAESRRLRLVDPLDVTQYETAGAAAASVRSPLLGEVIDLTVKAGATPSASR